MLMATQDWTVARRGTDTSGRGIYASAFYWFVWSRMLADPRLDSFRARIVMVQGPWMIYNGGGAVDSAGYHDRGGCGDVRTWNLTAAERAILWAVAAEYGFWFWPRDAAHGGMDEHGHSIAGWDHDLASGAATQWQQAKAGRDGLAGNGPDYVTRRGPLVTFPPAHLLEEDYMSSNAAEQKLDQILTRLDGLEKDLDSFRTNENRRDKAAATKAKDSKKQLVAEIAGAVDLITEGATKDDLARAKKKILAAMANDPDIDGADNPAAAS